MKKRHQKKQRKAMALVFAALLLIYVQASLVFSQSAGTTLERTTLHRSDFPKDFLFGSATSAYQVEGAVNEGGRGISIWDTWVHTTNRTNSDYGVDQYHRYEEDVELIASMNMDAYRFSIAWTRIFPDGCGPELNKEGVAYYNRLIDSLLSKGIKPFVTLFHWDLPQIFQDSFDGWMDRQIVEPYVAYAEACFAAFGDRVKNWITLNEPGVFILDGYSLGFFPPGRSSDEATEGYIVAHNFLLAHSAAVDLYRKKFQKEQKGVIGISVECVFAFPLTNSPEDKEAAERRLEFQTGWFLDPVFFGDYPAVMRQNVGSRLPSFSAEEMAMLRGSVDFIGLNHYTSRWATTGPGPPPGMKSSFELDQRVTLTAELNNVTIGPESASEWLYIVPRGIHGALNWISGRYHAPIYITENGVSDEANLSLKDSLRDTRRKHYYQDYLSAVLEAIREGVDVRGYFAWSLLDNFEWEQGFGKRFGIIYVDYADGYKRYLKDSALWFQKFLHRSESTYMRVFQSRQIFGIF